MLSSREEKKNNTMVFPKVKLVKTTFCTKGEINSKNNRKKLFARKAHGCSDTFINRRSSSEEEHKENALASGAEEGRD